MIAAIGGGLGLGGLADGVLTGLSVRMPTEMEPGLLLVVRATTPNGKRIAFIGAYNLGDALLAWGKRSRAGRMKWREDLPWQERGTGAEGPGRG